MDLLTQMCMHPTPRLMEEQLALAKSLMPKRTQMHEVWLQVTNDAGSITTFNDALYFIFAFLVGCPAYENYLMQHSNLKSALVSFLPILRRGFTSLIVARATLDTRAKTKQDKEFGDAMVFTMAMRSQYLIC